MTTAPKTVRVTAVNALPTLLDDAAREPIILERDGERFRLSRDEDIAYEPDPEGVRAMLAATAGSWADLDSDTMIREMYEIVASASRNDRELAG
jgi:hypothetical protein